MPDDGYLWYRAMPYADLHLGPRVRLFGELIAAFAEGVAQADTPVDETETDLLQGFAELQQPLGERVLSFRGGRQLLAYGSERLISTRYGLNVLRPFDGGVARLDAGPWRVDALYVRPVDTGLETFDDETGNNRACGHSTRPGPCRLARSRASTSTTLDTTTTGPYSTRARAMSGAARSARGFSGPPRLGLELRGLLSVR